MFVKDAFFHFRHTLSPKVGGIDIFDTNGRSLLYAQPSLLAELPPSVYQKEIAVVLRTENNIVLRKQQENNTAENEVLWDVTAVGSLLGGETPTDTVLRLLDLQSTTPLRLRLLAEYTATQALELGLAQNNVTNILFFVAGPQTHPYLPEYPENELLIDEDEAIGLIQTVPELLSQRLLLILNQDGLWKK